MVVVVEDSEQRRVRKGSGEVLSQIYLILESKLES